MKLPKCHFAQTRVHPLGHAVDADGIRVDEDEIDATIGTPTTTTRNGLRSFFVLAGYYRRLIEGFDKVSSDLYVSISGKGSSP